ncbi:RNase P subunit p30 [uncultured archaeon]|nr:RNase P subunit p30 [uncultured archaeon]
MKDITLFKHEGSLYFKLIRRKEDLTDFDFDGFLIETNGNEKEARRIVEVIRAKAKSKKIAVYGFSDEFNRRAIETLKIDCLVSPENNDGKDNLKQRTSGFNHVMAEAAKKKNIQIVEDLNWINSLSGKKKAIAISRLIQNVVICRKSKIDLKFATFARNESELLDEKQMKAIGFSFGMSSQQVSNIDNF